MEAFASNENKNILYTDYPFYKKTTNNGSMIELNNSDALAQAVKIWLVSKKNEKIRSRSGGVIYQFLGKMMDGDQKDAIKRSIIQGLSEDFNPPLTPVEITVNPDYEKQRWEIGIVAYNQDLAIGVNTKVIVTDNLF